MHFVLAQSQSRLVCVRASGCLYEGSSSAVRGVDSNVIAESRESESRSQRNSCASLSLVALQGGICNITKSEPVGLLRVPLFVLSRSWVGTCVPV